MLSEMKTITEKRCRRNVTNAVITVPYYFDDFEKAAIIEAAKIAGLNPERLIYEPIAAAMASRLFTEDNEEDKNVLVLHIGGAKVDASLICSSDGALDVVATVDHMNLGGVDLDAVIVEMCVNKIKKTIKAKN